MGARSEVMGSDVKLMFALKGKYKRILTNKVRSLPVFNYYVGR